MNRRAWIDIAKGQAILLVVVAHVWRGLRDASVLAWTPALQYLDYTIYSFHMPAFFALAGVTAYISDSKRRGWLTPVIQLYAVYLFWSLIQTSIMVSLSHFTTGNLSVRDIYLIPIKANAQFWFLLALIQFRIAANVLPTKVLLALSVVLFLCGALFLKSQNGFFQVCHYLIFFVAGYRPVEWIEQRFREVRRDEPLEKALPLLTGAVLVFPLAFMRFRLDYDSIFAIVLACTGTLALYFFARAIERKAIGRVFNELGRYSLAIYILHIMAASGVRIVALRLGLPHSGLLLFTACTTAGVVAPIGAYVLARRIDLEELFTMKWRWMTLRDRREPKETG